MEGTIKISIRINEFEARLLRELCALGWSESEVFRLGLRALHDGNFKIKRARATRVEMEAREKGATVSPGPPENPEDACRIKGGEVLVKDDGTKECHVQNGALEEIYAI